MLNSTRPPIRAALVSVGGSPDPILYTLKKDKPSHVWYFCSEGSRNSEGSRKIADEIQEQLDWNPKCDYIEETRFEELGPCYQALRTQIPELLKKWKIKPENVIVDYTGGTKTMSAALVLAGVEIFKQFSYIGGRQRTKNGLGITLWGQEKAIYQDNPWNQLAIRDIEHACDLWNAYQFEPAGKLISETSQRVDKPLKFEAMSNLAFAMAARQALDFKKARKSLNILTKQLPPFFDGKDNYHLLDFIEDSKELCAKCSNALKHSKTNKSESLKSTLMREILDNTLRTAKEGRYADAASRLYRAMEMQAQIWLELALPGVFSDGRCPEEKIPNIPESLRQQNYCKPTHRKDIRLGLEPIIYSLAHLIKNKLCKLPETTEHIILNINSDLAKEQKSQLRKATENRNKSILNHGLKPVSLEDFKSMSSIASELFTFDLTQETNPIPNLDPRWF